MDESEVLNNESCNKDLSHNVISQSSSASGLEFVSAGSTLMTSRSVPSMECQD